MVFSSFINTDNDILCIVGNKVALFEEDGDFKSVVKLQVNIEGEEEDITDSVPDGYKFIQVSENNCFLLFLDELAMTYEVYML